MFPIEMLDDEKVAERQNKLLFAQACRVPKDDELLLTFFNGRELEIPQDRILLGIFRCRGRHNTTGHCNGRLFVPAMEDSPVLLLLRGLALSAAAQDNQCPNGQ